IFTPISCYTDRMDAICFALLCSFSDNGQLKTDSSAATNPLGGGDRGRGWLAARRGSPFRGECPSQHDPLPADIRLPRHLDARSKPDFALDANGGINPLTALAHRSQPQPGAASLGVKPLPITHDDQFYPLRRPVQPDACLRCVSVLQ